MDDDWEVSLIKDEHISALNAAKLRLFDEQLLCDCSFRTVGKSISKCHRVIIAAASQRLFDHLLNNEQQPSGNEPVDLDVTLEAFQASMRFVYGCDTTLLENDFDLTAKVFHFACEWEMEYLKRIAARKCLKLAVSAKQMVPLYQKFKSISLTEEAQEMMKRICDKGNEVLELFGSSDAGELDESFVESFVQQGCINLYSEKDLYDAIERWRPRELAIADYDKILKKIRFGAFTEREVSSLSNRSARNGGPFRQLKRFLRSAKFNPAVPEELQGYDLYSGSRGKYDRRKTCTLKLEQRPYEPTEGCCGLQLRVSADVYLLCVKLNSLRGLKAGDQVHVAVQVKVKRHLEAPVVVESVEHELTLDADERKQMLRLRNPFLLRPRIDYLVTVTDLTKQQLIANFYHKPESYRVFPAGERNEIRILCAGVGDVCALQLARPKPAR